MPEPEDRWAAENLRFAAQPFILIRRNDGRYSLCHGTGQREYIGTYTAEEIIQILRNDFEDRLASIRRRQAARLSAQIDPLANLEFKL